jgi:hypothetical protein
LHRKQRARAPVLRTRWHDQQVEEKPVAQARRMSVAICTPYSHKLRRQILEQITKLVIPAGLSRGSLIVNHSGTDVLDENTGRLPLRRLFVFEQGWSHARNLMVRVANS